MKLSIKKTRLVSVYAFIIMAYHIVYASGILYKFNIDLGGYHAAISVGFILSLLFLSFPISKKSDTSRIPWYDLLFSILCLVPSLYYVSIFNKTLIKSLTPNMLEIVLGLIMFFLAFEATRRVIGFPLVIISAIFLIYPRFANSLPGILFASRVKWPRLIGDIYLGTQGIFSSTAHTFATTIAIFVVFGQLINISGGGQFFLDISLALMGKKKGGPAKAAVVGSGIFGMISGVAVANVMTTGTITIPMMKKMGYKAEFAAAVETVASTGGAIMPPVMGILAFVMADFLGIPYWSIVKAAILPGILYYIAVYLQVSFRSAKENMEGLRDEEIPSLKKTFKKGWFFLIPIFEMIYMFAALGWSPLRVGFYASVTVWIIYIVDTFVRTRSFKDVPKSSFEAITQSGVSLAKIMPAACLAGIIMSSVNITAIGLRLSSGLLELSNGNLLALLLLSALACLVMGTAVDLIVIYIIMAVLIAPALTSMGIIPLAAHLFILYYTVVGLITPPVCVATYAAASIAESKPFITGFSAMKLGFVAILLPFVFVVKPQLLLFGSFNEIVSILLFTLIGILSISASFEGYIFNTNLKHLVRIGLLVCGFVCFLNSFPVNIIGSVLCLIILGLVKTSDKKRPNTSEV